MFPVAILAGGRATRMLPVTARVPKAMVKVAGIPFIAHQLAYLRSQNLIDVVICVGHLGHMIRETVGDGKRFGLSVRYSDDGTNLLGTGGALRRALPLLGENFFVIYGDSFLPIDFMRVQENFSNIKPEAMMTILKNEGRWDKSNVKVVDGRLVEYDKRRPKADMNYIDYGLSIITSKSLKAYPIDQAFDLGDFYHDLSVVGRLEGFEVAERFFEIGSPSGLKEAEWYFSSKEVL